MAAQPAPPFRAQRLVCLALVIGQTLFAVVAAVLVQGNDGNGLAEGDLDVLSIPVVLMGFMLPVAALTLRRLFAKRAEELPPERRGQSRFLSRLLPLATLEGGSLFAITGYLLEGNAVPHLIVAGICLALSIALLPTHDVDAPAA